MKHLTKEQKMKLIDLNNKKIPTYKLVKTSVAIRKTLNKQKTKEKLEYQKKNKIRLKKETKQRLEKFAKELNDNLPPSEKWFWKHYNKYEEKNDVKNQPWGYFIYDVLNHKFKYAIEIDGKSHDLKHQKKRDHAKNEWVLRHGYVMIRIQAYSLNCFKKAIKALEKLKGKRHLELSKSAVTNLFELN